MTNLEKFKEWAQNATIEQVADLLIHEYDGILSTPDYEDFDDKDGEKALNHTVEWLKKEMDNEYWKKWEHISCISL